MKLSAAVFVVVRSTRCGIFGIDDVLLGGIIGGGLNFLGGERRNDAQEAMFNQGNQFNAQQAQLSREWSAEQAAKQMDFQERMSGSAYQRAIADMKASGLNPMLAYSQGGASTPGGAMGSSSAASSVSPPNFENSLGQGVHSAFEGARVVSENLSREQERNIKRPLESVATSADSTLKDIRGMVGPVSEAISELVQKVEDDIKSGSLSSAAADRVERTVQGAETLARDVVQRVVSPVREVAKRATSAVSSTVSEGWRKAGEFYHGKRGVEPPPSRGKVPRSAQQNFKRYEWKFNYKP